MEYDDVRTPHAERLRNELIYRKADDQLRAKFLSLRLLPIQVSAREARKYITIIRLLSPRPDDSISTF